MLLTSGQKDQGLLLAARTFLPTLHLPLLPPWIFPASTRHIGHPLGTSLSLGYISKTLFPQDLCPTPACPLQDPGKPVWTRTWLRSLNPNPTQTLHRLSHTAVSEITENHLDITYSELPWLQMWERGPREGRRLDGSRGGRKPRSKPSPAPRSLLWSSTPGLPPISSPV